MLAQARELAAAHLELRAIRQTLTVSELRVEMLEKQLRFGMYGMI